MNASPGPETIRLTMAQAVVKYLQAQYSERDGNVRRLIPAMFGIFGHGNVCGMGQALEECGADLPYYQPCNEQSMVHTAIGFAKASHRLATLACTASIGPGSTNMITGAAAATINRLPVLLFPSDYYATRHQGPVLQQLEHPISADVSVNDCFRPVSRFFDRITRPEQILTALPEAMRVLTDPAETGAVTIALPQDIQAHAYDYPAHFFRERRWRVERRAPDPERIREAVALLAAAQRPVLIAGGGVHYSEAWNELEEFAEALGIPVGETFAGKGALKEISPIALGGIGLEGTGTAAAIIAAADLVISVGTRLTDFATGSQSCFRHPEVRFININVCGHDAFKQGALPIVADAAIGACGPAPGALEAGVRPRAAYQAEVAKARGAWGEKMRAEVFQPREGEAMSQGQLIGLLNREAQPETRSSPPRAARPETCSSSGMSTGGRHCHLEFGYSCMGYEIPAGLGVRLAQPEGEVFVLIGDGTYLMNPTELVTAVQEGSKITVIVSENHGYQCIRRLQMWRTGISFGNEFRHRDPRPTGSKETTCRSTWPQMPRASAPGPGTSRRPINSSGRSARPAPKRAPCVIVAEVEKHRVLPGGGCWWDVAPAEVSQDPKTRELRAEYERDQSAVPAASLLRSDHHEHPARQRTRFLGRLVSQRSQADSLAAIPRRDRRGRLRVDRARPVWLPADRPADPARRARPARAEGDRGLRHGPPRRPGSLARPGKAGARRRRAGGGARRPLPRPDRRHVFRPLHRRAHQAVSTRWRRLETTDRRHAPDGRPGQGPARAATGLSPPRRNARRIRRPDRGLPRADRPRAGVRFASTPAITPIAAATPWPSSAAIMPASPTCT